MGFRKVWVDPNPIWPTISHISSILKDRTLYQPGAVSYRADTGWAEYEMIYLSYRPYHINPIYTTIRILYLIG